jgi:uncharacterized protein (TIGR03435 family)
MRTICVVALLASSAAAQTRAPLAFEVASVKINPQFSQDNRATWWPDIETTPGSLTMRNVDLRMMVAWAYDIQRAQVAAPEWTIAHRYDIVAKAPQRAPEAELRRMLQSLLAERFQLEVHRESRPMEAAAMLMPKAGSHKMMPSKSAGPSQSREDAARGTIVEGSTLAELAEQLSREVNMPVVDMTGLQGRFDFAFNPRKYVAAMQGRFAGEAHPPSEAEVRMILLQDVLAGELGLRLEARKAPVEVVVIDRAEKAPVSN